MAKILLLKPLKFSILIFTLILFWKCQTNKKLEGNYSYCYEKQYVEVYFKKDSMRVAADDYWVNLSEWRKVDIKNDTLYFETFGEWRYNAKAEIIYGRGNKIKLNVFEDEITLDLEPIKEKLNLSNDDIFWDEFRKRKKSSICN